MPEIPEDEVQNETETEATETSTAVATKPKKSKPKKSAAKKPASSKKPEAKVSTKKPAKKPTKKTSASASAKDRSLKSEIPAAQRRVAFVKLLRKMGATSATAAVAGSVIAEKLGYTPYDVYCLGYPKYKLATEGFVKSAKHEGQREVAYYLTAKGNKQDPE